jgi:hypothetical protein
MLRCSFARILSITFKGYVRVMCCPGRPPHLLWGGGGKQLMHMIVLALVVQKGSGI